MGTLQSTARAVATLAVEALAAESPAAAMRRVADALPVLLGVDAALFAQHGLDGMEVIHGVSPSSYWPVMPMHVAPIGSVRRLHPLIDHLCRHEPAAPAPMSDVIPDLAWRQLEVAELTRPVWGSNRQLHLGVASLGHGSDGAAVLGGWVLTRDGGDYSRREVELAAAVQPILDVVTRNYLVARGRQDVVFDLTPREVVVLRLAAQGASARRIGHALAVSPRTVEKHLEHAYRTLGVRDRVSAIRVATASGQLARALDGSAPSGQLF